MRCGLLLSLAFLLSSCADPQEQPEPAAPAATPAAAAEIPLVKGGTQVPPFDDARSDSTFEAFRDRLQQIVRSRDSAALESILDPRIRVSFGSSNGIAAFRRQWNPGSPASPLWPTLDRILALGGTFQPTPNGRRFVAPYVFANWPEAVDASEYLAPTCHETVVRASPATGGKALGRLQWQALKIGPDDPMRKGARNAAWRQVILPDGRAGWIDYSCAWSPMDYRAAFEKHDGGWRMVYFIAGD